MIGHADACHIDMSRFKGNLSPTSNASLNTSNIEGSSNYPTISTKSAFKETERSKVHFRNAEVAPEKDDIISLYGTPKEEMMSGVNMDAYGDDAEDGASEQGKNYCCSIFILEI